MSMNKNKLGDTGNDRYRLGIAVGVAALMLPFCFPHSDAMADEGSAVRQGETAMSLEIKSPRFQAMGEIPDKYTCDGQDISPPLRFAGIPEDARSLVLVVDDPDAPDPKAPRMTWDHWLLYNLPPQTRELPEAVGAADLPAGTLAGLNSWKRTTYGGPCPPIGRHRYHFKLYALDVMLPDLGAVNKKDLEKRLHGHILAKDELIGTYQR
jgi:Raf kinase inhibitor-like YbhB/YbcL family protein